MANNEKLDKTGLQILWNRIVELFVPKKDVDNLLKEKFENAEFKVDYETGELNYEWRESNE